MIVFHSLPQSPFAAEPVVATIGNFDGVHRGHRWIIDQVQERARTMGWKSLAITFDPHPVRALRPDAAHLLITPLSQKLELLASTGVDATMVLPFTHELASLTADSFAREILCAGVNAREIHEGENFRFGRGGVGSMQTLARLGEQLGFGVRAYPPYVLRGSPVSSSRIRNLIAEGEVARARALLGRPFSIRSTPASGRGYGTRYTVPTINLAPYGELIPANGVYITALTIGSECFQAVTNVGNRPTFGADSFTIESHLLDFRPIDLTEQTVLELAFLSRLRAERRFPSPDALREQIGQDVRRAVRYFRLTKPPGESTSQAQLMVSAQQA